MKSLALSMRSGAREEQSRVEMGGRGGGMGSGGQILAWDVAPHSIFPPQDVFKNSCKLLDARQIEPRILCPLD